MGENRTTGEDRTMGENEAMPNPAEEARKDIGEEVAKALPDEAVSDEEPPGEDTGSPAGRGGDVDWGPGDASTGRK